MNIVNLSCTSCGAPIQVTPDADQIRCPYCSTNLEIQRSEGQVGLRMGRQVSKSIEDASVQTRETIQHGAETTQSELKRLQLSQQVSMLQMQLSGLQAEIRSLQREKATRTTKRQVMDLKQQEASLINQIRTTQSALINMPVPQAAGRPGGSVSVAGVPVGGMVKATQAKNWWVAYLLCLLLGVLGAHRFYTGYAVLGIIQFFTVGGFGVWWVIDLVLIISELFQTRWKPISKFNL